jgi:hypothetical protein
MNGVTRMKYAVPVFIAIVTIVITITAALAQYKHAFPLSFPYVYSYIFAAGLLVVTLVMALRIARQEQPMPRVIATRYGKWKMGTGLHSHGDPVGMYGVILVNDAEPAYEVGVYPPAIEVGPFQLQFENTVRRLAKGDGEGQLSAWIRESNGSGVDGKGLFELMRKNGITDVMIPIQYKDSAERWYKTVCHIERDVIRARDGLLVRSQFRGRTRKLRP